MKIFYNVFLLAVLLLVSISSHAENFPSPAALKPDVNFWLRVYTEVDTRSGFIHDSRNLAVVYSTIRVNGGSRSNKKRVKNAKAKYASILKSLAKGKRTKLTKDEQRVLDMWGGANASNKRLKSAVNDLRFQRGQSDRFREGIIRSGEWRSYIDKTFKDLDLPVELAALPHVESSFNPRAYSHVGAAGMWQFIRSTGKRYMKIDYLVDERMDPFASTVAAAKLLRHNYQLTKSWPLALTAYNHGVASMRRAINKLGTRDIETIVRKYKGRAFGFASRNFYVAFLAALEVDKNPEKYFGSLHLVKPFEYELIKMDSYYFAKDVSKYLKINKTHLKRHNRSLLASVWSDTKRIPKGYSLRVPKSLLKKPAHNLLAAIPAEYKYKEQTPDLFHQVVRGDTISEIADLYGFRVRDIMLANNMSSGHFIRAGQKLRLPVKDKSGSIIVASAQKSVANKNLDKKKVEKTNVEEKAVAIEKPIVEVPPPVMVAEVEDKTEVALAEQQETPTLTAAPVEAIIDAADAENKSVLDVSVVAEPEINVAENATLLTDPADYTVNEDNTIEVQASETLGHYAEWLDLRASRLREVNKLRFGKPVVVGNRLLLDFSEVNQDEFERRRVAYQKSLQEEFFAQYRIDSTYQHTIKQGESLWVLALRKFKVPIWLLRQHNPDVNFNLMRPGVIIIVPNLIEAK